MFIFTKLYSPTESIKIFPGVIIKKNFTLNGDFVSLNDSEVLKNIPLEYLSEYEEPVYKKQRVKKDQKKEEKSSNSRISDNKNALKA